MMLVHQTDLVIQTYFSRMSSIRGTNTKKSLVGTTMLVKYGNSNNASKAAKRNKLGSNRVECIANSKVMISSFGFSDNIPLNLVAPT